MDAARLFVISLGLSCHLRGRAEVLREQVPAGEPLTVFALAVVTVQIVIMPEHVKHPTQVYLASFVFQQLSGHPPARHA